MIEIGAIASDTTNLTTRNINALQSRTASDGDNVQTVEMSFDDFIDMVNPLQHIPGVSTIYRAVAGEDINPVSRIAGDALYGGVFGVASAGISALCAIGDEAIGESNGGQPASAAIMTALLGDGKDSPTQVAQTTPNAPTQIASTTPTTPTPALVETPATTVPAAAQATAIASNTSASQPTGMPLDRSKLPYGGVMDSAMMASAQQNQTLALAMASQHNALQAQRSLHNSRLATGTAATQPQAAAADPTPSAAPTTSVTASNAPETQEAMQKLLSELQAMKAINQYKNAAQAAPQTGSSVNFAN